MQHGNGAISRFDSDAELVGVAVDAEAGEAFCSTLIKNAASQADAWDTAALIHETWRGQPWSRSQQSCFAWSSQELPGE